MTIEIKGNPGTGNTFMEIHIEYVANFHMAAIPVASMNNINNNGTHARPQGVEPPVNTAAHDTVLLRSEILAYINRLRSCLADEWKSSYQKIWDDILDTQVVSLSVYNPGKQRGTNFNRNLVANIIHYLNGKGAYGNSYNAARFAEFLEGDKDHSVRSALGKDPSNDIVSSLDRYFG